MDIITTITTNLNIYNTTLTITSFLWMYFVLNRTNFVAYRNVSPWRWFWPLLLPNHMFYNEMEDYHPSSWLMMSSVYGKAVKSFHFDVEHSIWKAYKLKSSSWMHIRIATKSVRLRTKYTNRKLVVVRVSLYMFKFDVIVVIMSIYDVEMVHFDWKWLFMTLMILQVYANLKRL